MAISNQPFSSEYKAGHYLMYVTRYDIFTNDKKVDVYEYEGDIFHAMGEIQYRSEDQIYRIDYAPYTEVKVKYWLENGYKIRKWRDKYPIKISEEKEKNR